MKRDSVQELIDRFGYPATVNEIAKPLMQCLLDEGQVEFERALCQLAERLIERVESKTMSSEEADQVFTLLDVFCSEREPGLTLSEYIEELLLEGQHFHHFGDIHGPNVGLMRELIRRGLGSVPGPSESP